VPISRMSSALFIIAFLARIGFPQAEASAVLVGRVTDERGAFMPSAQVTVRNVTANWCDLSRVMKMATFKLQYCPLNLRSAG